MVSTKHSSWVIGLRLHRIYVHAGVATVTIQCYHLLLLSIVLGGVIL
jgi:hypothetical protein